MWGPDAPHVAPDRAARHFGIAVAVFTTLAIVAKTNVPARPSAPREYPFSGLVTELGGLEANQVCTSTVHIYLVVTLQAQANQETILDDE